MFLLKIAALSGATAVGFGAFGAHGLKKIASEYAQQIWKTGAEYHLAHSLALLALGVLAKRVTDAKELAKYNRVAALFVTGIMLFSGSLYAMALKPGLKVGWVTPVGGVLLIGGWAGLIFL